MASVIFRPKVLTQVLSSANTDGVLCTILLSNEGSVLAYTGVDNSENRDVKDVAAVATSIWASFSKSVKQAFDQELLESVILECEEGNVVISKVATFLLCSYSKQNLEIGMLRAKTQALVNYLQEPLKSVQMS